MYLMYSIMYCKIMSSKGSLGSKISEVLLLISWYVSNVYNNYVFNYVWQIPELLLIIYIQLLYLLPIFSYSSYFMFCVYSQCYTIHIFIFNILMHAMACILKQDLFIYLNRSCSCYLCLCIPLIVLGVSKKKLHSLSIFKVY